MSHKCHICPAVTRRDVLVRAAHGFGSLALASLMEGGANVISEAIADGVPVLASRIDGSTGLLGAAYPGLFDAGNTQSLANLISRLETDASFYADLKARCLSLRPLFDPNREFRCWRDLLAGL